MCDQCNETQPVVAPITLQMFYDNLQAQIDALAKYQAELVEIIADQDKEISKLQDDLASIITVEEKPAERIVKLKK